MSPQRVDRYRYVRTAALAAIVALTGASRPGVVSAQSPPPLTPFRGLVDHVSVTQWGNVPYGSVNVTSNAISGDGRYVVMSSVESDLVPNDYNGAEDVFLRDRTAATTTRLSIPLDGGDADGMSQWPTISSDGRHVAFASGASNLVTGDTNGAWDVFVRDLDRQRTVRVSIAADGTESDRDSGFSAISATARDDSAVRHHCAVDHVGTRCRRTCDYRAVSRQRDDSAEHLAGLRTVRAALGREDAHIDRCPGRVAVTRDTWIERDADGDGHRFSEQGADWRGGIPGKRQRDWPGHLSATGSVTATTTLTTSALPHGTHKIEAVYLGDSVFRASTTPIVLAVN